MNKACAMLAVILLVFSLSACETMKGFGKDVEDAGEWVQKKAN